MTHREMKYSEHLRKATKRCVDHNPKGDCYQLRDVLWEDVIKTIESLESRTEKAEAERDEWKNKTEGITKDLISCKDHCDVCKHSREGVENCPKVDWDCLVCQSDKCVCRVCRNESKWRWRGLQGGG